MSSSSNTRILSFLILLLPFASSVHAERIAILQPTSKAGTLAGQNNQTASPLESAARVLPRFIEEATSKLRWTQLFDEAGSSFPLQWIRYEEALKAQMESQGDSFLKNEPPTVRQYLNIAKALDARYVVSFSIRELTGYRASSFLVDRKGGRSSISLIVFDAQAKQFVWQADKTETSIREQWLAGESLGRMMDQSLFNAVQTALEPFVVSGKRMRIKTDIVQTVARVVGLLGENMVLLDIGQDKNLSVGDFLVSFDGKTKLKVVEVLSNGTVAEIIEGEAKEGLIVKTSDESV
jgi:hypothetical protein